MEERHQVKINARNKSQVNRVCIETTDIHIFYTGLMSSWIFRVNNSAGVDRLCRDAEFMIGRNPSKYWRTCWGILTPIMMIFILLYTLVSFKPLTYKNQFYPSTAYGNFPILLWNCVNKKALNRAFSIKFHAFLSWRNRKWDILNVSTKCWSVAFFHAISFFLFLFCFTAKYHHYK